MSSNKNLLFLFDRPNEPMFMPKGKIKAVFNIPEKFFSKHYEKIGCDLRERYMKDAGMMIEVHETSMPDLTEPMKLDRQGNFSLFMPNHRKIAASLLEIFMNAKSIEELQVNRLFK